MKREKERGKESEEMRERQGGETGGRGGGSLRLLNEATQGRAEPAKLQGTRIDQRNDAIEKSYLQIVNTPRKRPGKISLGRNFIVLL